MREMIFNDASIRAPVQSIHDIRPLLSDIARGIASLISKGIVVSVLRMTNHWNSYQCAADGTLWDLLMFMQRDGRDRDEVRLLMRLTMKAPLLEDLPNEVVDRFLGCEPEVEVGACGDCLVLCAHVLGVAISMPTEPQFDRDQIIVRFQEILETLDVQDAEETIDNLARALHAEPIVARDRRKIIGSLSCRDLWEKRRVAFPNLSFGREVEQQLAGLDSGLLGPLTKRLTELDEAAEEWARNKTAAPRWRSKVSPESERVMSNAGLAVHRRFLDANGEPAIFEWHARMGSSYRVHFRIVRVMYVVEIGYIGPHLPLA
jgi:hypothetical protein